jgi:hypothetical protein
MLSRSSPLEQAFSKPQWCLMNERSVFIAAIQRQSGAERTAFLHDACGNDAKLRQQIEAILHEYEQLGSFLESPASAVIATNEKLIHECPATRSPRRAQRAEHLQVLVDFALRLLGKAEDIGVCVNWCGGDYS